MDCREIQDNLSAYMDRELTPVQEESIRTHLGVCEQCAVNYAELLKGWQLLDAWEDVMPSDRMSRKILESARTQRMAFPVRRVLSVAAALLLVFGITAYYAGQKGGSMQDLAGRQPSVQTAAVGDISEDEIIANLLILQENDFFDALDELVRIDDLPLDEESSNSRRGPERSASDLV